MTYQPSKFRSAAVHSNLHRSPVFFLPGLSGGKNKRVGLSSEKTICNGNILLEIHRFSYHHFSILLRAEFECEIEHLFYSGSPVC